MTTEPKAQHTPTPWAVYHWHPSDRDIVYIAPAGLDDSSYRVDEIATLYKRSAGESSDADANAELIVRAVNSHAALVEALEAALIFAMSMHSIFAGSNFTDRHNDAGRCERMVKMIESALAATKGAA